MIEVVIGVDAHKRTHTLVAANANGRKLGEKTIPTTSAGNQAAIRWARQRFGGGLVWGIEDCRPLTARLEHDLLATDAKVVRVPPHLMSRSRASSRTPGKSDPIDALAVARAVLREPDLPVAFHDPVSLELRLLVDRREDLVLYRTATINRLLARVHELDPTHTQSSNWHWKKARETMRDWLIPHAGLTAELARDEIADIIAASESIDALACRIGGLVRGVAPSLLALKGCGELTAAKIVAETAGVHRFKSEAAFARLAGVAPIPHWSGDANVRLRPARRGNRQLNSALHRIAVTQIRWDGPGKVYFERRLHDGDTRSQALRSLKRRLARVVFNRLRADQPRPALPL
ncbi:transposase [Mycolicibacterium sp. BK634]|uniref:IS110 family transposase n=1 Tax=Mycolicibacterium sp. BK634 TaxID=2587099 RepID=UPI000D34257B|nr:IS110 family transposase [Mycolicibacterium sp. BK634]MBB3753722.1 transposase [Mycolicibacterium sp. BK634]